VQEHEFDVAEVEDEWVYTYSDLTRDYLRHAAGVRQRQRSGGNDTDYYLEANSGALEFKTERDPVSEAIARTERTASLNQISGATFSATVSNLATSANYIEMYGGGTTGSSGGFDALIHRGSRHFLAGLGRFASRQGNNTYELRRVEAPWPSARPAGETSIPEKLTDLNEECGIKCLMWAADRVKNCDPIASAATGNLLHDFCCVPWICLAYYHILPEEEENDCFKCLCLVGNPADKDTPRGCLCKKLALLSEEDLGWKELVRRALDAREKCRRAKQALDDCDYSCHPDFSIEWCFQLLGDDSICSVMCPDIDIPVDECPFRTETSANVCCDRDQFHDWELNPDCDTILELFPDLPSWLMPIFLEPDCCHCLMSEIAIALQTFCKDKEECD